MSAYIVTIDSEIIDREGLAGVGRQLAAITEAHGGKYLVRGGAVDVRGGALHPVQMTVIEFESIEQARALFELESFAALRARRSQFAHANAFIVPGV
jgi:uncharacterized protein (DUF1330 family)